MKERIREFIITNFYVPDEDILTDDASLLEEGIVDSTGMLEVILFLEETFDIVVEDEEVIPDNLDTISRIEAFVSQKKSVDSE